jgi:hypothetical protein
MVRVARVKEEYPLIDQQKVIAVGVRLREVQIAGHGTWNAVNA